MIVFNIKGESEELFSVDSAEALAELLGIVETKVEQLPLTIDEFNRTAPEPQLNKIRPCRKGYDGDNIPGSV